MNYLSNVVTGFLAVGLLEMRGISGKSGWAWMFLIVSGSSINTVILTRCTIGGSDLLYVLLVWRFGNH
jgi:hypothetical protein